MYTKKISLSAVFLFFFGLSGLQAQSALTTTGGVFSGSGGTSSYSVGQVEFETHTGSNGTEAQGVQQAFEISEVNGLEEAHAITLIANVQPNPSNDDVTLFIGNVDPSAFSFTLSDNLGRNCFSGDLNEHQTRIEMSNLVSATYFLSISHNNQVVKTFKIIKN